MQGLPIGLHPSGDPPCINAALHLIMHLIGWHGVSHISSFHSFIMSTVSKLFPLGCVYMTSGVDSVCQHHPAFLQFIASCLTSHSSGDFGSLCDDDIATNQTALRYGGRIFSSYTIPALHDFCGSKLWVITESDRESTTVLFPGEY
jgi:hypothetical protein